jgi:aminoglycoside 3-N-acetyltransferase I
MKIKVRKLVETELAQFIELVTLFKTIFEMEPFSLPHEGHLQKVLSRKEFYAFVALDEHDRVIGGLTAYELTQYYSMKPLVYIYDVAVDSNWQRKGIGTQLITAVNNYCKEKGVAEVFVQAESVDGYALKFYRKTSAFEQDVVHFSYPLDKK